MKIYLRRVRLNQGGYTDYGCYFGVDAPLYNYFDENYDIQDYIRASNREHAKEIILRKYPDATFYR